MKTVDHQPRTIIVVFAVVIVIASVLAYLHYSHGVVRVRVTTTTSLYATGLLDYLADEFTKDHPNVRIEFLPLGSGEALRRAEMGDACVVFVHAPSLEKKYIEKGVIENGRIFAYNFFVIVGPKDDPANVKSAPTAVDAFKRIYEAGKEGSALFVSRGDNSGTHVRELMLWSLADLDPRGKSWYLETGQGMTETLIVADEKDAYTLSDIGTYLKLKKDGRLRSIVMLYTNQTELINVYSVYLVKSCSGKERRAAKEFAEFVYTHQDLIARYSVDKYGQPLFYPAKGKEDDLARAWEMLSKG